MKKSSSKKSLNKVTKNQDESFDDEIEDYEEASGMIEAQYEQVENGSNINSHRGLDTCDANEEVIIGSALVIYTFEGTVQNSISIIENLCASWKETAVMDGLL